MPNVHEFTAKTIDGVDKKLADYKGRVMLIVNVASKCGLTPQYKALEELHKTYASKGLSVVGFPANEFGAQEPGTEADIKSFCTTNYGVDFDMMSKVVVKGEGIHPLFEYLTFESKFADDIQWNFTKFLIGKDGFEVARFAPQVDPASAEVKAAIEKALG